MLLTFATFTCFRIFVSHEVCLVFLVERDDLTCYVSVAVRFPSDSFSYVLYNTNSIRETKKGALLWS